MQPKASDRPPHCDAILALLGTPPPAFGATGTTVDTALPTMPDLVIGRLAAPKEVPRGVLLAGGALAVGGAVLGIGVLVVALLVALGTRSDPDAPCPSEGGVLGVARVDGPVRRKKWKVPADTVVLEHIPTEGEEVRVVCLLPAGTTVLGVEGARKDGEAWATIVAEELLPPGEGGADDEGGGNGTCDGRSGERLGWFRTRPRLPIGGGPQVGQPWRPGAGREVVEWPPTEDHGGQPGPVVCALGDDAVQVVEAPIKIGRDYWVPYVVP